MQGARVGIAAMAAIGVIAFVAYLVLSAATTCGCGALPARSVSLVPADDGFVVAAASPSLTYGAVDVTIDGALVSLSQRPEPLFGEWSATRDGMPLDARSFILAGDVVRIAGPGSVVQMIDREANSIMAIVEAEA